MQPHIIYILRHGQTEYNKQRIVQGSGVDASLNKTGQEQAQAFFEHYRFHPFDPTIYTSALKRTQETVLPFIQGGNSNYQIYRMPELNEISWGLHEGKRSGKAQHNEYLRVKEQWENGNLKASVPKGESLFELLERLHCFIDFLFNQNHRQVLICTHGRTIRALLCCLLNEDINRMSYYKQKNTGFSKLRLNPVTSQYELFFTNNTEHLL